MLQLDICPLDAINTDFPALRCFWPTDMLYWKTVAYFSGPETD